MPAREISIANRHPRLRLDRRAVSHAIHTLDAGFRRAVVPPGELSLVFLTDPALARLHADFLGDPSPTDVITFEGDSLAGAAGEICVSVDAALRQVSGFAAPASAGIRRRAAASAAINPSPRPPSRSPISALPSRISDFRALSAEITLYLVHGWLHLAGYDDLEPRKKRAMRRAEARAMELLRRRGSLPRFTLRP